MQTNPNGSGCVYYWQGYSFVFYLFTAGITQSSSHTEAQISTNPAPIDEHRQEEFHYSILQTLDLRMEISPGLKATMILLQRINFARFGDYRSQ